MGSLTILIRSFDILMRSFGFVGCFPVKHVEWFWDWLEEQEVEGALVFYPDIESFQSHAGMLGRPLRLF